jgi:hypothetical protein
LRQELLLLRIIDGEASWFERVRAQRLLQRNSAAQRFFDQLKDLSVYVRQHYISGVEQQLLVTQELRGELTGAKALFDAKFCERVMARIEQEEQHAVYSGALTPGRRGQQRRADSPSSWLPSIDRLSWGLSGAAVAAMFTMVLTERSLVGAKYVDAGAGSTPVIESVESTGAYSGTPRPLYSRAGLPARANVANDVASQAHARAVQGLGMTELATVSALAGTRAPENRVFRPGLELMSEDPIGVEVDWVRSHGRVRVLQNRESRTAIIWVRRPQALPLAREQYVRGLPITTEIDNLQAPQAVATQQMVADVQGQYSKGQYRGAQSSIPRALPVGNSEVLE